MSFLVLAAALLLPQDTPAADDFFPPANGAMILTLGASGKPVTYTEFIRQYAALTGQVVSYSLDTKDILSDRIPLYTSMTVPADEVQMSFECLLAKGDLLCFPMKRDGTRVIEIKSLATAEVARVSQSAVYLEPDEVHLADQHPAMLFRTVVAMPSTNVRFFTNAIRSIIVDANTQQLVPAGESNAITVTGVGPAVMRWSRLLKDVEAASAASYLRGAVERRVFRLKNRAPGEIAALLTASFGAPAEAPEPVRFSFLPDAASNSLLVAAPAHRLPEIEKIVKALDVE